jgi:hypothetical protein
MQTIMRIYDLGSAGYHISIIFIINSTRQITYGILCRNFRLWAVFESFSRPAVHTLRQRFDP